MTEMMDTKNIKLLKYDARKLGCWWRHPPVRKQRVAFDNLKSDLYVQNILIDCFSCFIYQFKLSSYKNLSIKS